MLTVDYIIYLFRKCFSYAESHTSADVPDALKRSLQHTAAALDALRFASDRREAGEKFFNEVEHLACKRHVLRNKGSDRALVCEKIVLHVPRHKLRIGAACVKLHPVTAIFLRHLTAKLVQGYLLGCGQLAQRHAAQPSVCPGAFGVVRKLVCKYVPERIVRVPVEVYHSSGVEAVALGIGIRVVEFDPYVERLRNVVVYLCKLRLAGDDRLVVRDRRVPHLALSVPLIVRLDIFSGFGYTVVVGSV